MSKNLAITLSLILVAVVGIALLAYNADGNGDGAPAADADATADTEDLPTVPADVLVGEDSRHLDEVDDAAVTIVEFLDFECGACAQQHPVMEEIRDDYDGEINTVIRYFPLAGHVNAEPAAAAVEAAAQQGAFEEMYSQVLETQASWGGAQQDQSDVFVGFADDLGLDTDEFVDTMESAETQERLQADLDDGATAGVEGTPTIYVNGRLAPSMPSYEQLSHMIDSELEEGSADSEGTEDAGGGDADSDEGEDSEAESSEETDG